MRQAISYVLRLAAIILGLTLVVSLVLLVIGAIFRWAAPVQFSNGFFIAGAILIVLGVFSVTGGFQQRASFPMTYAESAGQAPRAERTQRMMSDIHQRYGSMVLLVGSGVLLVGIAILIHQLT